MFVINCASLNDDDDGWSIWLKMTIDMTVTITDCPGWRPLGRSARFRPRRLLASDAGQLLLYILFLVSVIEDAKTRFPVDAGDVEDLSLKSVTSLTFLAHFRIHCLKHFFCKYEMKIWCCFLLLNIFFFNLFEGIFYNW